jgi:hypothetical protein
MIRISINVTNLTVAQMDANATSTCAHIAGGGFDFGCAWHCATHRIMNWGAADGVGHMRLFDQFEDE